MSLSPCNERSNGLYTLGDASSAEVKPGVAWSSILGRTCNVFYRKAAFIAAGLPVVTAALNVQVRVTAPMVVLGNRHPVDVHVHAAGTEVDLHETWTALADAYGRRYEVVLYFSDGQVAILTASGTARAATPVRTVEIRLQPLLHATIVHVDNVSTHPLAPGMQLWARRLTRTAMQVVPFHFSRGYQCAACGRWDQTLAAALTHSNGGKLSQYVCVAANAVPMAAQPPAPRAATATQHSLPVNGRTLRRKLEALWR